MNVFVCLSLIAVFWGGFLQTIGLLPGIFVLIPEVIGAIAFVVTIFLGVQTRFENVRIAYWLVFGFVVLNMIAGVVANAVDVGPIIAGLRFYFAAVPFFFLPLIYPFTEKQRHAQILVVLVCGLLQVPVALYQRMLTTELGMLTGDRIVGSLSISSHLSMFLISVIAVLVAYRVGQKLTWPRFLALVAVLALPTMINETKSTLFFLPLAVMVPAYFAAAGTQRIRNLFVSLTVASLLLAAFVPIYDYYMVPRQGYGILTFLTKEGRVEGYLSKDAEVTSDRIGRVDSYTLPLKELSKDPVSLGVGLGIGNVRKSVLGERFTGGYASRYEHLLTTGVAVLLWETGVIGLLIVFGVHFIIFTDAVRLARSDSTFRLFGAGWIFIVAMFGIGLFYKSLLENEAIALMYWLFSGHVAMAARRVAWPEKVAAS